MAIMYLNPDADLHQVQKDLQRQGYVVGQRLADGVYVVYAHRRKWMALLYPDLATLYEQDREFWKRVRRRKRNGEDISPDEIQAHAEQFKQQEKEIIDRYERRKKTDHSGNS